MTNLTEGLQVRAATIDVLDADTGHISLQVVPYETEAELAPRLFESFKRGSFDRIAATPHRVKLFLDHGGPLIGHGTEIRSSDAGVRVDFHVSDTASGREARTLAGDGTLDQASIEFTPQKHEVRQDPRGTHVRHTRSHLLGVALVPHGAYRDGTGVLAVRDVRSAAEEAVEARRAGILAALASLAH